MRATDLMIGDWVYCHQPECKGHRIDYINEADEEVGADGEIYSIDDINQIPLTPESLEKNGFRIDKEDTGDLEYYCLGEVGEETCVVVKKHALNALEDLDVIWSIYVEDFAIYDKILYVHELQHALKLCGIEKTIELCNETMKSS